MILAIELKFESVINMRPVDVVKYYFPDVTDDEADYILWEETCFPMDTDIFLRQLYDLYLSGVNFEWLKTKSK